MKRDREGELDDTIASLGPAGSSPAKNDVAGGGSPAKRGDVAGAGSPVERGDVAGGGSPAQRGNIAGGGSPVKRGDVAGGGSPALRDDIASAHTAVGGGAAAREDAATLGGVEPPAHGPPALSWPSATDADPARAGSALARYRFEALIGRGGMGEVVSAHDDQIGRRVAIKRMRVATPSAEIKQRFLREARIQGRLDHPAVVPVHELWHDERGQPFFVMKQLTGITLENVLAQPEAERTFTRQQLLRAFVDVCLAIEFAHTRGVIHRDLKPANIMLGDFGEVYVLDWGIARVAGDDTTRTGFEDVDTLDGGGTVVGAILGTPGYMSAEQASGDPDLDARTDVHALGCILFEILANKSLYPRGQAGIAATLQGADARPSLRAPEREIAPELDAACVGATMLDRRDRIASARELGDAVQRYLDGDRDLATRRALAKTELETARAALAAGDTAAQRQIAIRAAARALALDPHGHEPAELVGRLMLQPPDETPREVQDELHQLDLQQAQAHARLTWRAMSAYLLFFPIMYFAGFHEAWYMIGGPLLVLGVVATTGAMAYRPSVPLFYVAFVFNVGLIAMFSRIASPFLIAPALGAITAMLFAMHRLSGPGWGLWGGMTLAVLGPWVLELGAVVSPTTSIAGNNLVLEMAAGRIEPTIAFAGLGFYIVMMLALATAMSRAVANERSVVQRRLQIQSWQLRQLVPTAS